MAAIDRLTESDRAALRAAAFVDGLAVPLVDERGRHFGPHVVLLTPSRCNLLALYSSPLVTGGPLDRWATLQGLYLLSPDFRAGSRWGLRLFLARWFWLPMPRTGQALQRWLAAQFAERGSIPQEVRNGDEDGAEISDYWLSNFVHSCRRVLDLREAEVLHAPYIRLFCYLAGLGQQNPEMPKFNRARDKARGEYLRRKWAAANASKHQPSPT